MHNKDLTKNEQEMLAILASYPKLIYRLLECKTNTKIDPIQLSGRYLMYILGMKICNRLKLKNIFKFIGIDKIAKRILRVNQ